MPARTPRLADEASLDASTVDRLLSNLGTGVVLVGGQALAFWMDRYGIATGSDAAVTNDADFVGTLAQARDLARAIGARVVTPPKRARTALVAQLRLPTAEGKERNVDVLHVLYTTGGLRKSSAFTRRVVADSIEVSWADGASFRVMDPFDMLDSRVQNAAGLLDEKGPHVLEQARWAIAVARESLRRLALEKTGGERLGRSLQALYTLAHSRAGRTLLREHGLDVLEAVDVAALERLAPGHEPQLRKISAAIDKRRPDIAPRPSRRR